MGGWGIAKRYPKETGLWGIAKRYPSHPFHCINGLLVLRQIWIDGLAATCLLAKQCRNMVGQANRGARQSKFDGALVGNEARGDVNGKASYFLLLAASSPLVAAILTCLG